MKIEVLYFAHLRDAFATGSETLTVPDGGTVGDALDVLAKRGEWKAVSAIPLSFAVNERVVDRGHTLNDGDRLALLAPLSGG